MEFVKCIKTNITYTPVFKVRNHCYSDILMSSTLYFVVYFFHIHITKVSFELINIYMKKNYILISKLIN